MKRSHRIDEYIATLPDAVRSDIVALRGLLCRLVPQGEEDFCYGMPTIRVHNRILVHFAAATRHIGFYPTPSGIAAFEKEIAGVYAYSKGAIRFPLGKRVPAALVTRIVRFRLREEDARKRHKNKVVY